LNPQNKNIVFSTAFDHRIKIMKKTLQKQSPAYKKSRPHYCHADLICK